MKPPSPPVEDVTAAKSTPFLPSISRELTLSWIKVRGTCGTIQKILFSRSTLPPLHANPPLRPFFRQAPNSGYRILAIEQKPSSWHNFLKSGQLSGFNIILSEGLISAFARRTQIASMDDAPSPGLHPILQSQCPRLGNFLLERCGQRRNCVMVPSPSSH